MSKKIQIVIFLLIVAAVVVVGIYKAKENAAKKQKIPDIKTEVKAKNSEPKATYVEPEKLPERFPADFPMEAGAEILQNYNFEKDGSVQSSRSFVTKKTLKQNFELYENYLNKNGWTIIAKKDQPDSKLLSAQKNGATLSIEFSTDPQEKKNFVSVNFVFNK